MFKNERMNMLRKGRFGKLFFGATGGLKHDWDVKRESLSPRYTTNLADLPKART